MSGTLPVNTCFLPTLRPLWAHEGSFYDLNRGKSPLSTWQVPRSRVRTRNDGCRPRMMRVMAVLVGQFGASRAGSWSKINSCAWAGCLIEMSYLLRGNDLIRKDMWWIMGHGSSQMGQLPSMTVFLPQSALKVSLLWGWWAHPGICSAQKSNSEISKTVKGRPTAPESRL